jgi:hypothetical protein
VAAEITAEKAILAADRCIEGRITAKTIEAIR